MTSEVKGIWFDSALRWLTRTRGPGAAVQLDARVSEPYRGILLEPLVSDWYPEQALAELLAAMRAELTDGSDEAFVDVIEQITLDGVGRFFRLVLSLASPAFVVRKVPVLWGRMRRGAGRVEVEAGDDVIHLHYREFPWFADDNYRLLTVGSLRGVCVASGASNPDVQIVDASDDSLDVDVRV